MYAKVKKGGYSQRICGMKKSLAQELRNVLRGGDKDAMNAWGIKQLAQLEEALKHVPDCLIGIGFGSVFESAVTLTSKNLAADGVPDVFMYLITDPTDIDSKQVTFVSNKMKAPNRVFDKTYKFPQGKKFGNNLMLMGEVKEEEKLEI